MGFLIIFPAGSVIQITDRVREDLVPAAGLIGATGNGGDFGLPAAGVIEGAREGRESAVPAVLIGNLALDGVEELFFPAVKVVGRAFVVGIDEVVHEV